MSLLHKAPGYYKAELSMEDFERNGKALIRLKCFVGDHFEVKSIAQHEDGWEVWKSFGKKNIEYLLVKVNKKRTVARAYFRSKPGVKWRAALREMEAKIDELKEVRFKDFVKESVEEVRAHRNQHSKADAEQYQNRRRR